MKSAAESKFHLTRIMTDLPKICEFEIGWTGQVFRLNFPHRVFEGDNTDLVVSRNAVSFMLINELEVVPAGH